MTGHIAGQILFDACQLGNRKKTQPVRKYYPQWWRFFVFLLRIISLIEFPAGIVFKLDLVKSKNLG